MATMKKASTVAKNVTAKAVVGQAEKPPVENKLDEQEEKVLDWILKGVVAFVLGWLGIAILMVLGGYFHLWG